MRIRHECKCSVTVPRELSTTGERTVNLTGTEAALAHARMLVLQLIDGTTKASHCHISAYADHAGLMLASYPTSEVSGSLQLLEH
jgi:hypothetical protein